MSTPSDTVLFLITLAPFLLSSLLLILSALLYPLSSSSPLYLLFSPIVFPFPLPFNQPSSLSCFSRYFSSSVYLLVLFSCCPSLLDNFYFSSFISKLAFLYVDFFISIVIASYVSPSHTSFFFSLLPSLSSLAR